MFESPSDLFVEKETYFVEVILPLPIAKTYTYRVPFLLNQNLEVGKRAIVQFGKNKIYTAIIYKINQKPPELFEAKYLLDILDELPIIHCKQLQLWNWISSYYLCPLGDVMQAALPAALKLASETSIILNKNLTYDKNILTDKEFLIIEALEIQPELKIQDVSKLLNQKTVLPLLKSLFEKNILQIQEEIIEKYKPRFKHFISLNPFYQNSTNRKKLFEQLERAPKQLDVVLTYLKLKKTQKEISKTDLIENSRASASVIDTLTLKNIFSVQKKQVDRLYFNDNDSIQSFKLSTSQQIALDKINNQLIEKNVVLLHGITASGKTQIYARLIEQMLQSGKQILYLLPEIALTTHLVERLRNYFNDQIGVYHSRFNDNERAEIWQKMLKKEYKIILGARSAVFLPFSNLGLVIIDEEHETSYKQQNPSPRYHARDTAIYLAHSHQAKVVLGSATPSFESYYNTKIHKYGLVSLNERFGNTKSPNFEVISIAEEIKRKTMQSHFTSVLIKEIEQALSRKEQVILFQNRRGYTPILLCATCGYIPKCLHCDVTLTYHKYSGLLHCHYCGYKQETINNCPACGSAKIQQKGFGTEKIEDELKLLFENARIARMDLDSTRKKNSFQNLMHNFEEGNIDILIGTQMVTKGLDFSNVTTIGVINADSLLKYPDFRAFERGFQLLCQVAGRAGRRDKPGKIIIQTYDTKHRVIDQVVHQRYQELFDIEILERKNFKYPPFYKLIQLNVQHKDSVKLNGIAKNFSTILRQVFGDRVLGPETPLVGKIRNYYIQTILLKIEKKDISAVKVKEILKNILVQFESNSNHKGCLIQIDVDPY